jgi:predicted RNA-binding protein with PIN domain
MTVYLIDGYNVLHQLIERPRGEARAGRPSAGPGRQHAGPGRPGRGRSSRQGAGVAAQPSEAGGAQPGGAGGARPGQSGARQAPALASAGGEAYLEEERRRLIDRIADYMGGTSDRAIVVFDSRTQMLQKIESATANVEVYFGSFSRSADSVIEREVYAISAGESVVVVSSDYQLQKTIFVPNVIRRSSRQFVADLQEHTKRIANPQNCITMSHRVEERIDPSTVDRLKALRDELAAASEAADRPGPGYDA